VTAASVRRLAGLLLVVSLSGCQLMPSVATLDPPPEPVQSPAAPVRALLTVRPPAPSGAIFQSTQYRPLFEDHRARLVGDALLVQIVERVSASARSSSNIEKKGALSGGISAVPFLPVSMLGKFSIGGDSANTFSGKGGTENSNNFSGTITAVVTDVLTNGHLIVSGSTTTWMCCASPGRWIHAPSSRATPWPRPRLPMSASSRRAGVVKLTPSASAGSRGTSST
jgi:flagellar L-ring protein precursor FlgH